MKKLSSGPKVLYLDIELWPVVGDLWRIFGEMRLGIKQIKQDWAILSVAAMWSYDEKMMYKDVRKKRDLYDDFELVEWIRDLIDEADIVVTQNGDRFDLPKIRARIAIHRAAGKNITPFAEPKSIDTRRLAKKKFGFTSNSLEYLSEVLCPHLAKSKHKEFPGHELWRECYARNPKAWLEMQKYNCQDVVALHGVHMAIRPWGDGLNYNLWTNDDEPSKCNCGGNFVLNGSKNYMTGVGRYQRYRCSTCGREARSRINEFTKEKKGNLKSELP